MTDVVAEVKEVVDVEKEASDHQDEVVKKTEVEKNGDAEKKTENGSEDTEKSEENGNVKENGVSDKDVPTESSEVCGIKRKSEAGLETEEAPVESSEKKQKLEESAEKEIEANGS